MPSNDANLAKIRKDMARLARIPGRALPGVAKAHCEAVASAARESVHVDSGELRDSIEVLGGRHGPALAECAVEVDSDHALPTEYGTSDQVARPFFRPAISKARGHLGPAVESALSRELGK